MTTTVASMDNWIPQLLKQWPSGLDQAVVALPNGKTSEIKRLDGRWPWMQPIDQILGSSYYPVANFYDGCDTNQLPSNITGKIALITRTTTTTCTWSDKFLRAQHAGAAGVVVYSEQGVPLKDINCRKISCYLVSIPVTMISYTDGMEIIQALNQGSAVQMKFTSTVTWGQSFAIDCNSELQEMGNFQYPSMSFLAWEAQYFDYYRDMLNTVAASTVTGTSDFVVNVYNNVMSSSKLRRGGRN